MTNTTTAARSGFLLSVLLVAAVGCAAPQPVEGIQPPAAVDEVAARSEGQGDAGVAQDGRSPGTPAPPDDAPQESALPESAPQESALPESALIPDPAAIPVHRALPAAADEEAPPPTRLMVAGTSIDLSVVAVGISAGNQMEIPDAVDRAGWYRYGPAPGEAAGTAVIAAHVDTLSGLAPFSELRQLQPNTAITVERAEAEALTYRVTEVELMDKDEFDAATVFRRDGKPLLKLVTCGGTWLDGRQDYSHNVVVTAVPD
ncbi:sortase domain-bontaining protein [Arthrobacter sulfonylureivorans]|uniref:class F sortase n=1 Tax=Arthrobacter sulfonylureivorans TaxID=2486855 RepID=UPI0039E330D4